MSTLKGQLQDSLALLETPRELPVFNNPTPGQLLQLALTKDSGIDVIERITALMEKERDYQARVSFDEAKTSCQAQIGRIAPNAKRENGIMWADYAQIDRAIRPIYVKEGFSISFSEMEKTPAGRMRMKAELSRGGVSKDYFAEITTAPPNSKMSQADAEASAASRVKRYLLLDIFNISIGIDADEKKPFQNGPAMDERTVNEYIVSIEGSGDQTELQNNYFSARDAATKASDLKAIEMFANAKNKRLAQLNRMNGGRK